MISLVIPVHNERANLPELWERISNAATDWGEPFEAVFVDDGSSDGSFELLAELARTQPACKVLRLTRNFGQQAALSAGLQHSSGRIVALLDADLQDPPELIARLASKLDEGYGVAYAIRQRRRGNPIKRACYWIFYRVLRWMADVPLPRDAGDFCAMTREAVDHLNALPERSRYLRGLRAWIGLPQCGIPYDRPERHAGVPHYTPAKLVRLALDGLTAFSFKPLRLFGYLGILVSGTSFALLILFSVAKLLDLEITGHQLGRIPGFFYIFFLVGFLGGLQLVGLGLLGEYIGRIFEEAKGRPIFLVRDRINFPE